jgi:deaminated glutathione amidase
MTHPTVAIACIQMTTTNDMEANIAEVERLIRLAASEGAELIATPENCFYMRALDTDHVPLFPMKSHIGLLRVQELAQELRVWVLIGSLFVPSTLEAKEGERWFNRSILVNPEGAIVAHYDKIHLFDACFGENRFYKESARICPGDRVTVAETPWGKMGMTICYDVRFPHLYRDLAKHGVEILAIPAAFARVTGEAHWHVLLRARAIENGAFVIAPAQCGEHPGNKRTFGHAMIISPWGEIMAEAGDEPCVIHAKLEMARVKEVRTNLPTLTHDRHYLPPPDYVI